MTIRRINVQRVKALPAQPVADTMYFVKPDGQSFVQQFLTNNSGAIVAEVVGAAGPPGPVSVVTANGSNGDFDVGGSLSEQGQQVYHTGNVGELMDKTNLLINGGFDVWQRGTSFSSTYSSYAADRWIVHGNSTINRVTDTPDTTSQFAMQATSGDWGNGISQIIEDGATRLKDKTITVSAWVKGPIGKTARIEIGWGPAGSLFTFTGNWQRIEAELLVAASVASNAPGGHLYLHIVRKGNGTIANGDSVTVSNAIVYEGAGIGIDMFDRRRFAEELTLCQRYFQKSHDYAAAPGAATGINSGSMLNSAHGSGSFGAFTSYQVAMRSTPTMTIYDHNGVSGGVTYFNGSWNGGGAASVTAAAEKGLYVQSNISGSIQTAFAFTLEAEL